MRMSDSEYEIRTINDRVTKFHIIDSIPIPYSNFHLATKWLSRGALTIECEDIMREILKSYPNIRNVR